MAPEPVILVYSILYGWANDLHMVASLSVRSNPGYRPCLYCGQIRSQERPRKVVNHMLPFCQSIKSVNRMIILTYWYMHVSRKCISQS